MAKKQEKLQNFKKLNMANKLIFLWIFAASCYSAQPRHTTYVQDAVRGWNGRWYAIGEKRVCPEPCQICLVNPKTFKGDTLRFYSVRK